MLQSSRKANIISRYELVTQGGRGRNTEDDKRDIVISEYLQNMYHVSSSNMITIANNVFAGFPDSKVHGANMGPIWGRQEPGEPFFGPMNLAI